ncbi:MAG: spore maturation protein [Clostridia bacterium]|nr:spore maturation protein [Clostridia bacterium]
MVNAIWVVLLLGGLVAGAATGRLEAVTGALAGEGANAVRAALQLAGVVSVWFGVSRIAERAGLIELLGRALRPFIRRLFPELPAGHPATGAIVMNMAANMLGLGNAATPFGLQAMRELQAANPDPDRASPAMVTFLALNSAALSLVPATTVAIRAAAGSREPAWVVAPAACATGLAMAAVLLATAAWRRYLARAGRG